MLQPFITPSQLKSIAAISDSVETQFLVPFIQTTQDMVIVPVLGLALATEISNQILSGNTSVQNQVLIDEYILPCLAYATWAQAAVFGGIKMYKKSLVKPNGENSETLSIEEMKFYKANIDNMSNYYKSRLYDFLEDDANSSVPVYPLYRTTADNEFRGTGTQTTGFYFKVKR